MSARAAGSEPIRAVVMTGPAADSSQTEVRDLPEPLPGPGQISIDVSHAGINFIDVMARRGDPGYASGWPLIPGLEVAGTVRRLGSDVTGFRRGQRVSAFTGGGGLASVAVASAELTVPIPDSVSSAVAAAAPLMLTTALLLLEQVVRLRPADRLLMHSAAGGVGAGIAQMAGAMGVGSRVGTVGSPAKVAEAEKLGWDLVLPRDEGLADAIASATGGVDVILEPLGTEMLELDLELAAPGCRIALFGNPSGGPPLPLPPLGRLIAGNLAIAGFSISRLSAEDPRRVADGLRRALGMLADDALDIPIFEVESLTAVAAVHDRLADRRGRGKYVVAVS